MPKKKKTTAKLKKDLDSWFSRYIRLKHSNDLGYVRCYTCGKSDFYKNQHCGHYIPRNILVTRFDENNCRPQCVGCNLYGNGKFIDFRLNLVKELGEDKVLEMERSRFNIMKIDSSWYESKIGFYKEKVKEYERNKKV